MRPTIALIDGDIFRYEVGSIETDHPFLPNFKIPGDKSLIDKILDDRITGILEAVKCEDHIIFITGKGNFRETIAVTEPYKGHRANKEKPYHWKTVHDRLVDHWLAVTVNGCEADDILGISQRAYNEAEHRSVICSRDKDLRMIGGWHYSWACGEHQKEKPLYVISDEDAKRFFWKQMLTGDWSTDHIPGCAQIVDAIWKTGNRKGNPYRKREGIGEVAADKLLFGCTTEQEMFYIVKQAYKDMFQDKWAEQMLEQGRLLAIGYTNEELWEIPTW